MSLGLQADTYEMTLQNAFVTKIWKGHHWLLVPIRIVQFSGGTNKLFCELQCIRQ